MKFILFILFLLKIIHSEIYNLQHYRTMSQNKNPAGRNLGILQTVFDGLGAGLAGKFIHDTFKYQPDQRRQLIDQSILLSETNQSLQFVSQNISHHITSILELISSCEEKMNFLKSKTLNSCYQLRGSAEAVSNH